MAHQGLALLRSYATIISWSVYWWFGAPRRLSFWSLPSIIRAVQGINQVAIAEGMLLGISLGLAPELLASIINSSTGNFLALPPLNHFSRNLSVLGRSWSSEVNNPSPGALKDKSPPCERKYKDGFASKLFEIDPLSWKSRTISHVCTLGYTPCIKCSGKCQCAHTSGPRALELYEEMIHADKDTMWSHNGALLPREDQDFSIVYDYLMQLQAPIRHP